MRVGGSVSVGLHTKELAQGRHPLWSSHLLHSESVLSAYFSAVQHQRFNKYAHDSEVKQHTILFTVAHVMAN